MDTLLLIETYKIHESLFRNVNYRKKSVWEKIRGEMVRVSPEFSARPEQVEGKWKSLTAAFRKCSDSNKTSGAGRKERTFYNELSEVQLRAKRALNQDHSPRTPSLLFLFSLR